MSAPELEIQLLAVLVAVACALPGVFLVLRRLALVSDAISHTILLGIVLAFFVVEDITSPLLIVAAALTGVLTVFIIESLRRTGLLAEDAAIGLTFPFLFAGGVILVSRYADSVHLDVDAVLVGEIVFAPFSRLELFGHDLGPESVWVMGAILAVSLLLLGLFFKELKLTTFDQGLAVALGFSPALLHYGLMSLVSLTAVGAFDAVGSILVVAFFIAPPATAYLLTDSLSRMLALAALAAVVSALGGFWLARVLDASVAGAMAAVALLVFLGSFLLAPERGLLATWRLRRRQAREFILATLVIHLAQHERHEGDEGDEGSADAAAESRLSHLSVHLGWPAELATRRVEWAQARGLLGLDGDQLVLTPSGRALATRTLAGLGTRGLGPKDDPGSEDTLGSE